MRSSFVLIFVSFYFFSNAQTKNDDTGKSIDFLLYMAGTHQTNECNFYGEQLLNDTTLSIESKDSISFLLGEINLRNKNTGKAYNYFRRVSGASLFYYKSQFTSAMLDVDDKRYDTATVHLQQMEVDSNSILVKELKDFEIAGLSLLTNDHATFDSLSKQFNSSDTLLQSEQQTLQLNALQLRLVKKKSALVAGLLSAVIPGLGKVYTGNNGQALAAFLRVVPMGIIALENYQHSGFKDAQFITFASLFSIFYIGNIWGSALSVQITKNEKINEIHHNISVGLHIPVQRFFR